MTKCFFFNSFVYESQKKINLRIIVSNAFPYSELTYCYSPDIVYTYVCTLSTTAGSMVLVLDSSSEYEALMRRNWLLDLFKAFI